MQPKASDTTAPDINDRIRQLLKGQPGVRHKKKQCLCTNSWYHGKSTRKGGRWQEEYTCPECGRKGKFLRNYLGQRWVMCNGIRFIKEAQ